MQSPEKCLPSWLPFPTFTKSLKTIRRLSTLHEEHSLLTGYRPPTKLQEGNVFTCVCLFTGRNGVPIWPLPMMHWTSLYRPPGLGLGLGSHVGCQGRGVGPGGGGWDWGTRAGGLYSEVQCIVGNGILMECFLITTCKWSLWRLCFHRCLSVHRGCLPHTPGQTLTQADTRPLGTPPPMSRHPLGTHPPLGTHTSSLPWADTPQQTTPWANTPRADTLHADTLHADTLPSPSACWDTVNKQASHWNSFLLTNSFIISVH